MTGLLAMPASLAMPGSLALLLSCAPEPLALEAVPTATGVDVSGNLPLDEVALFDSRGAPVVRRSLPEPATPVALTAPLSPGSFRVRATAAGQWAEYAFSVADRPVSEVPVAAPITQADLQIVALPFPVGPDGRKDPSQPPDRVVVPSPWWRFFLRSTGLGWRPRGDQAPFGLAGVTLSNRADHPVTVVVRQRIVGPDGASAAAFRPRLRGMDGQIDAIEALLQVPAMSTATAVLPVYVDAHLLDETTRAFVREVEVTALDGPSWHGSAPLAVRRGSTFASAGFCAVLVTAAIGWTVLFTRIRSWLDRLATADLVTVALFGSLSFVVGSASQLVGLGIASFLGPFAPLLMGLFDDAFRMALLATLVTLLPRPGVASLATLVGYVMRGLSLGSFHPVDALYLGATVFWMEGLLWLVGLTRGARPETLLLPRLALGFGLANVALVAASLVVSVVLYRLYFAAWYVALILAIPGFAYVVVAAVLAAPFARSMREVS